MSTFEFRKIKNVSDIYELKGKCIVYFSNDSCKFCKEFNSLFERIGLMYLYKTKDINSVKFYKFIIDDDLHEVHISTSDVVTTLPTINGYIDNTSFKKGQEEAKRIKKVFSIAPSKTYSNMEKLKIGFLDQLREFDDIFKNPSFDKFR